MRYQVNIYLDKNAQRVGEGPHRDAYLAAHLWFKATSDKGWVPVADPVTLSKSQDTVSFAMADIYGDLDTQAKYKVRFVNPGGQGVQSPFSQELTEQLECGSYPWTQGNERLAGLGISTPYVRTASPPHELTLTNESPPGGFEFSIEVDDGNNSEVYYMDPRMIVDP